MTDNFSLSVSHDKLKLVGYRWHIGCPMKLESRDLLEGEK